MVIEVNGTLRRITGQKTVRVDTPARATLGGLLRELIRAYPELEEILLDENGALRGELPLFVNGRNPRLQSEPLEILLAPEDSVCLFSPVSSGRMNVEVLRRRTPGEEG